MVWAAAAHAQAQTPALSSWDTALPAPQLKSSSQLAEQLPAELRDQLPSHIRAEQISGQADINVVLEGGAELRRGDTIIRADRVEYSLPDDTVQAQGNVHINSGGNIYQGTSLKLQVDAFQGTSTKPPTSFWPPRVMVMPSASSFWIVKTAWSIRPPTPPVCATTAPAGSLTG